MIYNFEGIPNVRGLGGYVMQDGRKIRAGKLVRGGSLAKATDKDIERMREFGVCHIFDFRSERERQLFPDRVMEGVKYTWLPTIDMVTDQKVESLPHEAYMNLEQYLLTEAFTEKVQRLAKVMYPDMIDNEYTQLQHAAFIQNIINTSEGSIYWHCSQGKDRTGLGAAFLLFALGADRETVVRDFDLSNDYYKAEVDRACEKVRERGGGEAELDAVCSFIGVGTKNFEATLDKIDREYGGMMSYLKNMILISEEDMEILRDRYLE